MNGDKDTGVSGGPLDMVLNQLPGLLKECKYLKAGELCLSLLREKPDSPILYVKLGQAYEGQGIVAKAAECYQQALQLKPEFVEAYLRLGTLLNAHGRHHDAAVLYQQMVRARPAELQGWVELARTRLFLGDAGEALRHCEYVLNKMPGNIEATALVATIEERMGALDKAYKRLLPLVQSRPLHPSVVTAFGNVCRSLGRWTEAIALLEQHLVDGGMISRSDRASVHFLLGQLYDNAKNYRRAFPHFEEANRNRYDGFDRARPQADVDTTISVYTRGFMRQMTRAANRSERPVFVVGMPRSGTTLVEQILSSHPDVFGAGELSDLTNMMLSLHEELDVEQRYIECVPLLTRETLNTLSRRYLDHLESLDDTAARVIDKMPGNFMYLGLIELLFPGAHIIHCRRNPVDTCLSCYFQNFAGGTSYTYNLTDLGIVYRNYYRMMEHWGEVLSIPMFEVHYEELVNNPQQMIRSLVDFCGLPWSEECLRQDQNDRFVNTVSYSQVRRRIHGESVGRWQHYEQYLAPLIAELGGLADAG